MLLWRRKSSKLQLCERLFPNVCITAREFGAGGIAPPQHRLSMGDTAARRQRGANSKDAVRLDSFNERKKRERKKKKKSSVFWDFLE